MSRGFWEEGVERFCLGPWLIDPLGATLENAGRIHQVDHKAMAVLATLASQPGRTWTKAELFDAVWPDIAVSDDVLTVAVSTLRKALADKRCNVVAISVPTISRARYTVLPSS